MTNPPGPHRDDPRPDQPEPPTQRNGTPSPPPAAAAAGPPPGQPPGAPGPPPTKDAADAAKPERRPRPRDPLSTVLILVIVLALVVAGLIGSEIYARHTAVEKVSAAAGCVAEDKANVSFSAMPPFLWQHINGQYDNITITTAGNQINSAKGMKADVTINDVDLHGDANSKGTIGALDATITWTSDGIHQTIQDSIPLVGSFLGDVKTNPSDGTVGLHGTFGDLVAKPQVTNNKLTLQVVSLSVLDILGGFTLPRESVQPALDTVTDKLAAELPLGIHADSVQVTDTGVVGQFSTRNAKIPKESQDPCFASL